MGHENGGWMNDDQRSAVKDRADAKRAEWAARIGKRVCVTIIPKGSDEPHTVSGEIFEIKDDEIRCKDDAGCFFAFAIADITEAANWRGTILIHLK